MSDSIWQLVKEATRLSLAHSDGYVGTEHLLHAVLLADASTLTTVDRSRVRATIETVLPHLDGQLTFVGPPDCQTPRLKHVVQTAIQLKQNDPSLSASQAISTAMNREPEDSFCRRILNALESSSSESVIGE